jgi:Gnt-I system high-affinity gluconate transporter
MSLLVVIGGIVLLLILMLVFKLDPFLSFIVVSLAVGLGEGMTFEDTVSSIEKGMGNTLGYLVIVIGFGAMLGKIVAESGAAQKITTRMINTFGLKRIQLSVMIVGFIIGVPLFYDVGFVVLIPLIFTVAASTGLPLLYVALPMLASLSVTHGFLPPHPAPTAIVHTFGADLGKTMLYGIFIAIPVILLSGPVFYRLVKKVDAKPMHDFVNLNQLPDNKFPGLWNSILTALMPVLLIGTATVFKIFIPEQSPIIKAVEYVGNPIVAMIISVLLATYTLGVAQGRKIADVMRSMSTSVASLTMVLLVIAGAGGLKQILTDSGVSKLIGESLSSTGISPLILGWLIATILRISVGSATVAGITTAGIVLPLVHGTGVSPELMVIAIGSGSLMTAHVNDGGFWLVKEYFNLSIKDTLLTWTVMETCIGVSGLVGVLVMDIFV